MDRSEVLPHAMFQVLADFVEEECSPGIVDWEWDETHSAVRAEMQDHYEWWKNEYLPFDAYAGLDDSVCRPFREWFEPGDNGTMAMKPPTGAEKEYFDTAAKLEEDMNAELCRRLHRLIEIREYFWT